MWWDNPPWSQKSIMHIGSMQLWQPKSLPWWQRHQMTIPAPNTTTYRLLAEAVLLNGNSFMGYLMPKIPKSDDLYDLLQPQQRAAQHPGLNHRHLYRSARNLALAMDAIHRKGYVIGDVNFRNALFNDQALITVVDCDSMQVTDAQNVVHRCSLASLNTRHPNCKAKTSPKLFAPPTTMPSGLAVLTFQLLMQGFHPFAQPLPVRQMSSKCMFIASPTNIPVCNQPNVCTTQGSTTYWGVTR
jgi:DNA-binding helix-hairpin-helix protein with protein kinase domain